MKYSIKKTSDEICRFGMHAKEREMRVSVVSKSDACFLLLYKRNEEQTSAEIAFPRESRRGDVYYMDIEIEDIADLSEYEYNFRDDRGVFADPYGVSYSGRDAYGKVEQYGNPRRSPVMVPDYDWEGDAQLGRDISEAVIYKIHVRGLTMSPSSKAIQKGTFDGVIEKIDYMKELGINTVLLMPCQEYEEIMKPDTGKYAPIMDDKPSGKINYWGYVKSVGPAPKASFCRKKGRNPASECRDMVKALHKEGIEVIFEIFFDGSEEIGYVLDVIRYWALEYHADGIRIVGYAPNALIAGDPYLSGIKIFSSSWDGVSRGDIKHLGQYNDAFKNDMRRVLKGDEGMMKSLLFHSSNNPANAAPINYMADTEGFTLMDTLSYDIKHNEANGEKNSDGTDMNYSWNCGEEGPSRKKKIQLLRDRQYRNAILLLMLSQGTPLILSGDEFGRTKKGNNNSYCQDNEISWIDWKLMKRNSHILDFVKHAIEFRKKHPVFRYPEQPMILDTLACGQPDVSYHGVNAWQPEFENWRRQLGILYCGEYATLDDGSKDESIYVLYNMHWEAHTFALPSPEKGRRWYLSMDTALDTINGYYEEADEKPLTDEKQYLVEARSIVVLVGKKDTRATRVSKASKVSKRSKVSNVSKISKKVKVKKSHGSV